MVLIPSDQWFSAPSDGLALASAAVSLLQWTSGPLTGSLPALVSGSISMPVIEKSRSAGSDGILAMFCRRCHVKMREAAIPQITIQVE
jgi:hypothetical protein